MGRNLVERDRKCVWHPFTQEKTAPPPIPIVRGQGAYVYDENEKAYLDLISSWWVNLHGHAQPEIAQAIYDQAMTLEHIIFGSFTHAPAVTVCERIIALLPKTLEKCFFSDNGSTAVEVALKMAYQYWVNQGQSSRKLFLHLDGAYHGDTFGAMSVSAEDGFHAPFKPLCFKTLSVPFPSTFLDDEVVEEKEAEALRVLEQRLVQHSGEIVALIIEPIVQGASGMRMCRPSFVNRLVDRVQAAGILVIFDEVMTGFGRTGKMFALDHLAVTPDILCLSKGITGGFLPLSLTITTRHMYEAFLDDSPTKAFLHGHSYSANPLACAAALKSLDILQRPETQQAIDAISQAHVEGLARLPGILHPRHRGAIAAFDLPTTTDMSALKKRFLDAGLLLRPLGHTVYLIPPYIVTPDMLSEVYTTIAHLIA